MASKKGIAITIIILGAITGLVLKWTIPQQNETTFIITDYENYLDGAKKSMKFYKHQLRLNIKNIG